MAITTWWSLTPFKDSPGLTSLLSDLLPWLSSGQSLWKACSPQRSASRHTAKKKRKESESESNKYRPRTFSGRHCRRWSPQREGPARKKKTWVRGEGTQHRKDRRGVARAMTKRSPKTSVVKNLSSKSILEGEDQMWRKKIYLEITWIIRIHCKEFQSFDRKLRMN